MARLTKVKLKAIPVFPTNSVAGIGIDVTRTAGQFTIDLDVSDFQRAPVLTADAANIWAVSWGDVTTDNPDGVWQLTPFSTFQPVPAALTRTNDTNVTLALGGTPATALLQATSITLGWTGTLAPGRGGFGADISASSGVPLFAAGVPTFTSTSGTGNFVRVTNAALVTPDLGTPSAAVLTNATGTAAGLTAGHVTTNANLTGPIASTGNVTSITSQTGTGTKFVVDTSPTISGLTVTGSFTATGLVTNADLANSTISGVALGSSLGTLTFGGHLAAGGSSYNGSAGVTISTDATAFNVASTLMSRDGAGQVAATTFTGALAGNATTVTTNANLTGDVTSVGNATTLTNAPVIAKVLTGYTSGAGTISAADSILSAIQKLNGNNATNANLTGVITSVGNATSIASQTGTGTKFVVDTSPTLITPNLGVPTVLTLTNATGLPLSTGISGAGTGVLAALAINIGSAGAVVTFNGALGTPSSGVATNLTGTAAGLTAGNVTTNANLTGLVTSSGNATSLALGQVKNSLVADVTMTLQSTYYDGPSVSNTTTGTWFASGTITLTSTNGDYFFVKLWDGTTLIASTTILVFANSYGSVSLSGYLASPAANLRISAFNNNSAGGKIVFNATGNSKDSTLSAYRIA